MENVVATGPLVLGMDVMDNTKNGTLYEMLAWSLREEQYGKDKGKLRCYMWSSYTFETLKEAVAQRAKIEKAHAEAHPDEPRETYRIFRVTREEVVEVPTHRRRRTMEELREALDVLRGSNDEQAKPLLIQLSNALTELEDLRALKLQMLEVKAAAAKSDEFKEEMNRQCRMKKEERENTRLERMRGDKLMERCKQLQKILAKHRRDITNAIGPPGQPMDLEALSD